MTLGIYANALEPAENPPLHRALPQELIRKEMARAGILTVRLIGPPGSGKTALIDATLKRLTAPRRVGVIVINPAAQRDAERLLPHCRHVESIDDAVPRASHVRRAVERLPIKDIDLVLIEACGGLASIDDLGQDATVATFAVGGGDDKAAEYHELLKASSVVLLTQMDLRPLVKFDESLFRRDVQAANPTAEIFELSAVTGAGMSRWIDWLDGHRAGKARRNTPPQDPDQTRPDAFFG